MLRPDPDDVAQEVELQRLLGRIVSPRIVRRRMEVAETVRAEAERIRAATVGNPCPSRTPPDPARFPLLAARLAGETVVDMMARLGLGRQAVARRVREELDTYLEES